MKVFLLDKLFYSSIFDEFEMSSYSTGPFQPGVPLVPQGPPLTNPYFETKILKEPVEQPAKGEKNEYYATNSNSQWNSSSYILRYLSAI
jgi:hypothetical protein